MPTPNRKLKRKTAIASLIFSLPFLGLGIPMIFRTLSREGSLSTLPELLLGLMLFFSGCILFYMFYIRRDAFSSIRSGPLVRGCFDYSESPYFPRFRVEKSPKGRLVLPVIRSHESRANLLFSIAGGLLLFPVSLFAVGAFSGGFREAAPGILLGALTGLVSTSLAIWGLVDLQKARKGSVAIVELDHEPVTPGIPFHFFVRQRGKLPVSKMELHLVGEEVSSWYSRGKRNERGEGRLVEHRYRFVFEKIGGAQEIPEGKTNLVLTGTGVVPHGAMHSLHTPSCRIAWGLEVRLVIEGQPDIRETFQFRVIPVDPTVMGEEPGDGQVEEEPNESEPQTGENQVEPLAHDEQEQEESTGKEDPTHG